MHSKIIGRIVCFVTRKHLRGKLVDVVSIAPGEMARTFSCPRCAARWTRKSKPRDKPREALRVAAG